MQKLFLSLIVLGLLLLQMTANAEAQTIQWAPTNGPNGDDILSLTVSGTSLFAGTYSKGVYRSNNNGDSWVQLRNGPTGYVGALMTRGSEIFAGSNSGVYRSTDNGDTWNESGNFAAPRSLISLGTMLFAGTDGSGIYRSSDDGGNWVLDSSAPSGEVLALATLGNTVFAADGGLISSTDYGDTWKNLNVGGVEAIAVSGTTLFAGCYSQGVTRSVDGGKTWAVIDSGIPNDGPYGIAAYSFCVSGNTILVYTYDTGIFFSTNSGNTWTACNNGYNGDAANAMVAIGGNLFAGMGYGPGGGVVYRASNPFWSSAPERPQELQVSSGANNVNLTWISSLTSNILYRVYRTLTSGVQYSRIIDSIASTRARDTSLTNGKQYFYVVRAFDPATGLESANSNEVSSIPLAQDSGWADMRIALQSNKTSVVEKSGDQITYSIDYSNRGTAHAKNVEIIAEVLGNSQYVSGSAMVTGSNTTLWFTTQSGDVFDSGAQWTQTEPATLQITGIKWAIPDYAPDCSVCDSRVAFKTALLNSAACGSLVSAQAEVREGNNSADTMKNALVTASVICSYNLQLVGVDYSPKPLHYGEPFTIIFTIHNSGVTASPEVDNMRFTMTNLVTRSDGSIANEIMAVADITDPKNPSTIAIPSINAGQSQTLTISGVYCIDPAAFRIVQDLQDIGPNRIMRFDFGNFESETDPAKRAAFVWSASVDVYPNSNDKLNCAIGFFTAVTGVLGQEGIDVATVLLNSVTAWTPVLDAFETNNYWECIDAFVKIINAASIDIFKKVVPQLIDKTLLNALSMVPALWDGANGCAHEILYNIEAFLEGTQIAWDQASMHSPAYLSVQYPNGLMTGTLPSDSALRQINPSFILHDSTDGAMYNVFPHRDTLDFQLFGFATGPFTFVTSMRLDTSSHKLLRIKFQDSATPGMYAYFHYRKGVTPYKLEIDRNGDGTTDTIIAPTNVEIIDTGGTILAVRQTEDAADGIVPSLMMNVYPNPMAMSASLRYTIKAKTPVSITVYDALGRIVARPLSGELEDVGEHEMTLKSENLLPGLYSCMLNDGGLKRFSKILVVR